MDPNARARLDETMAQIAGQTDATLHVYHHPGRAARRVVLRDTRNDRGTQFEAAQLEDDGTLRVTGHHTGPGVSEFFGDATPWPGDLVGFLSARLSASHCSGVHFALGCDLSSVPHEGGVVDSPDCARWGCPCCGDASPPSYGIEDDTHEVIERLARFLAA